MPGRGKPGGYNIKPIRKFNDPNYLSYQQKIQKQREDSSKLNEDKDYWRKECEVQSIYGNESLKSK